jgi:hypothetical protein
MHDRFVPLVLSFGLAAGCGGTETGNPIDPGSTLGHFEASSCKKGTGLADGSVGQTQQALVTSSEYEGLQCIAWERKDGGAVTLQLLNFPGGCGVTWDGRAEKNGATLELRLVNTDCRNARCGSCIYDYRFDLSGIAESSELPLKIGTMECATDPAVHWDYETTLHLADGREGVVCRYAPRGTLVWVGKCAERNLPCGSDAVCGMTCAGGLTCASVDGASDTRCLASCQADADCSPATAMTCQDGTCRLATTW